MTAPCLRFLTIWIALTLAAPAHAQFGQQHHSFGFVAREENNVGLCVFDGRDEFGVRRLRFGNFHRRRGCDAKRFERADDLIAQAVAVLVVRVDDDDALATELLDDETRERGTLRGVGRVDTEKVAIALLGERHFGRGGRDDDER